MRTLASFTLAFSSLLVLSAVPAHATIVTFGTTGSFNGSASTLNNAITFGGGSNTVTVTYNGLVAGTSVDVNGFTFSNLGQFVVTTAGTGAAITAGTTFALTVTQTLPSGASGFLSATADGVLAQNSSTGSVTFSVTSLTLGGITYALVTNPEVLVPPSTNGGVTTIQAKITGVPEPTSIGLIGAGLIVLVGIGKRRLGVRAFLKSN